MGIPFYCSYDYYTVLVSFLTNPAIYYSFFSDARLLNTFWFPLLNAEDSSKVFNRIGAHVKEGNGKTIGEAIKVLDGIKLKCSAISDVMKKLQEED